MLNRAALSLGAFALSAASTPIFYFGHRSSDLICCPLSQLIDDGEVPVPWWRRWQIQSPTLGIILTRTKNSILWGFAGHGLGVGIDYTTGLPPCAGFVAAWGTLYGATISVPRYRL